MAAAKDLFLEVLARPVSERWAWLDSACAGDAALRREVAELLSYHGQSGDLFDTLGVEELAARFPLDLPERLGEYVIDGLLGVGAMGVVYRARRTGPGAAPPSGASEAGEEPNAVMPAVALKVLRGTSLTGDSRHRFRREVEALTKLDHPGIARLVDSGTFDTPNGPLPYVAMELVDGVSLRQWAAGRSRLPGEVLPLLRQLAEALEYAHARGVIHRDLKPENILIDADGRPRILDFGMARLTDPAITGETLMTRVGQVVGTIPYMSPEQAQAGPEPIDERADLYSLGVVAYELLAGKLPFDIPTDSLHRAIVGILTAEARPLGRVNEACRGDLEYVIHRLIEKRPGDRFTSATEVLRALDDVASGRGLKRVESPTGRRQRPLWLKRLAGAAAVALIVAISLTLWRIRPGQPPELIPKNRAVVADALRHVSAAGNLLHAGQPTKSVIRAGLAHLDTAEARLQTLPATMPIASVYRLLFWRRGEGHYFLGSQLNSKEEFWRARAAWERSWGQWDKPWSPAAVDSTMEIYRDVLASRPNDPIGGMVLAHMALAGYERPLTHLRQAEDYARQAFRGIREAAAGLPWRAESEAQRETLHGYCMSLNNLSSIRARLACVSGDTAGLALGLSGLNEADQRWPARQVAEPRGAHLHNLGRAYRYRAVLLGQDADFDSAEVTFQRALAYRSAGEAPRAFAVTQFERARALLDRPRATADQLRRTLLQVQTARTVIAPLADILEAAEGRLVEAELRIALAERGAHAEFTVVDTLLAEAAATATLERFPLQHTEVLRVKARSAAARARITGQAGFRAEAMRDLTDAIELTSSIEEPARYRRLVATREAIARKG